MFYVAFMTLFLKKIKLRLKSQFIAQIKNFDSVHLNDEFFVCVLWHAKFLQVNKAKPMFSIYLVCDLIDRFWLDSNKKPVRNKPVWNFVIVTKSYLRLDQSNRNFLGVITWLYIYQIMIQDTYLMLVKLRFTLKTPSFHTVSRKGCSINIPPNPYKMRIVLASFRITINTRSKS